jgi:hypothetical protein
VFMLNGFDCLQAVRNLIMLKVSDGLGFECHLDLDSLSQSGRELRSYRHYEVPTNPQMELVAPNQSLESSILAGFPILIPQKPI